MENTFSLDSKLQGKQITQLQIGYTFGLLCDDGSLITIEADFKLSWNNQSQHIQISKGEVLVQTFPILHSIIIHCDVKESALFMRFHSRDSLIIEFEVQPLPQYEAWQIHLANKKLYVCTPSGAIVCFQEKPLPPLR